MNTQEELIRGVAEATGADLEDVSESDARPDEETDVPSAYGRLVV